jgi:hypothetical protein
MWFLIYLGLGLERVDVITSSEPLVDNVRFGSKADIGVCVRDVRFNPKNGHSKGYVSVVCF